MELERKAAAWRRQFRRRASIEGALKIATAAAAAAILLVWLDSAFALPQAVRLGALCCGAAALGAGVFACLIEPWRKTGWPEILDAAAARFPELKDYLRTAWDLRGGGPAHTSSELRQAHLERTERMLKTLPAMPVFPWRPSAWLKRSAAAALCGAFTIPWIYGSASWQRVLVPWKDVPLERFIRVSPGDAEVDWGRGTEIEARWASLPGARDVKLWLRSPGRSWRSAAWDKTLADGLGYSVAELTEPLSYRLSWRDLQTREYRLTPVPIPRLSSLRAQIRSAQGTTTVPLSSAEPLPVLRGSWVTVMGQPNQELSKAALRASWLPAAIAMKRSDQGLSASFAVQEEGSFQLELETENGRRDAQPELFRLKVLVDEPPKIELLSPVMPLQASPADTIPITYSAQDDMGLASLWLLIRVPGRKEAEIPLQRFARPKLEFLSDYPWELSGLPHGTKVEFQLKAFDNASPPQSALSQKGSIEIVDFEAAHAAMERRWLETEKRLEALAAREEELRDRLVQASPADVERMLAGLPQDWRESTDGLSKLSHEMEQDAYANPGLSAQAQAVASELKNAQRDRLGPALESARGPDKAAASKRHGQLARQVRKAQRLLKEGAGVQGLQDFFNQASRMNQAGEELQSALEAMAARPSKKPSAAELSGLKSALSKLQRQMSQLRQTIEAMPQPQSPAEERGRRGVEVPVNAAKASADALEKALADGDFAAAAKIAKELSARLDDIQKGILQAASSAPGSPAGAQSSARMERAQKAWSEVVEKQAKSMEKTQRLEDRKLQKLLQEQKEMLEKLARDQSVLVSSAEAIGVPFPQEALMPMRAVQKEFESRKIATASAALGYVSTRLRSEPSLRRLGSRRAEAFAAAEEEIRRQLESAPSAPRENQPDEESRAASLDQAEVRQKTQGLESELEGLSDEAAALPNDTVEKVSQAQGEQKAAEDSLSRGDSAGGMHHQETALSLLEQGLKEMSQASQGQKGMEQGVGEPFSRPASAVRSSGGGQGSGAKMSFVALPTAKDYRPPKAIREELERSLQENRPASYDRTVKEYFKRIAQ